MAKTSDLTLTDQLDPWHVALRSGQEVTVHAHGVKEVDGRYVFVALMRGQPNFEVELCSVPMDLVEELLSG